MTLLRRTVLASALVATSGQLLSAQMTRQQMAEMTAKYPPQPRPTNLQVLPKDIAIPDLVEYMTRFSEGLGVQCDFCHVPRPHSHELNFPSDVNPHKVKARTMLRMVLSINRTYLNQLPETHPSGPVGCGTCHQGKEVPPTYKPPTGYHLE